MNTITIYDAEKLARAAGYPVSLVGDARCAADRKSAADLIAQWALDADLDDDELDDVLAACEEWGYDPTA